MSASAFTAYTYRKTATHLIPSLVYILPEPTEGLHVIVGLEAETGTSQHPVNKTNAVYGNLKALFKSDLIRDEKEAAWHYRFDRNLGFGDTDALAISKEFVRSLVENLPQLNVTEAKQAGTFYVGKPAYTSLALERRYERRVKAIFADLGFQKTPAFIYEPYAVYYYCRFVLGKPFLHNGSLKTARVLVVDHGGGTVNTCVVEIDRKGNIRTSRPKGAQASSGGGNVIDYVLLRRKILESDLDEGVKTALLHKERLSFSRLTECLREIERAKLACAQVANGGVQAKLDLGAVNGESVSLPISITAAEIDESFSLVWNRHCRTTIAATLGTDETKKIDYVVLAGGTCRLKRHQTYIERDFGAYLIPGQTEFVDISDADKPVVQGLCIQAYLERVKKDPTFLRSTTELQQENLSDFVARDLYLQVTNQSDDDGSKESVADVVLFPAGMPKEALWDKEHELGVTLKRRLKRTFGFAIRSDEHHDGMYASSDLHTVTIRRKMLDALEKHIKVRTQVNDDGQCRPRLYLAPRKHPEYYEPDKEQFHLLIPDLAKGKPYRKETPIAFGEVVLGFDFGTSVSAISSLNVSVAREILEAGKPFVTGIGTVEHAREEIAQRTDEISLNPDDRRILREVERLDPVIALSFQQFLADINASRLSYKGTACELRAVIELTLDKLAPEEEVKKKYKPDPQSGRVSYSNRARYILEERRTRDVQEVKKCAEAVSVIDENVGNILRGVHKRASTVVHTGAADEVQELQRLHRYFRAIMTDLLC
jgi:Hsp70 protein